jgi:membrane fusion protein (multidrug efflux system)
MTERFGQYVTRSSRSEAMSQLTKARESSGLTLVPQDETIDTATAVAVPTEAKAPEKAPGQSEGRGPLPALPPPPAVQAASTAPDKRNTWRKRMLMGGVAGLVLLGAGWFGYDYLTVGRYLISTDDAYVRAYNTTLGAKVSGYVSEFLVDDNVKVHAGDVIARIDDGDYRLAVDAAHDRIATQEATIDRFDRQIAAQRASVEQAQAQLVSAQASQKRSQLEFERQQALAGKDFASRQTLEQSIANRDQSNAAVQSARAAIDGAAASVEVLQAQQKEAARTLDELKTALTKAERDLSFTEIRAPVDGVVGNRAAQPGDFVQTGQRIAALVPLADVFIDANFKETQLGRLQPGQPVSIKVDALPGESLDGVVASVSPASGSVFSLLPPDNATGNFTKIVQRLPVRIKVPADVAARGALRPGMSVVVAVNTKSDAAASSATRTAAN